MTATNPINASTDFTRWFRESGKPTAQWAVGIEIEVIGFTRDTLARLTPGQIESVIDGFAPAILSTQWEDGLCIEATLTDGKLTVEPGGQLEFSTPAYVSLTDLERTLSGYMARLRDIGERLGLIFLATGFDPLRRLGEQSWFPKRRYQVMRPYLRMRGQRAWDMMSRTAAIQVNLDYSDLDDLAMKFTLANRLAPIAAALFANSPFVEGKLSGYKSTRYAVWLETDAHRTGAPPGTFDGDFSLAHFLAYARHVPMFFIRRDNDYIDLTGFDFDRFLENGFEGHRPIWQDFTDQLSTIFTEARLKPHIEQRSMDCGRLDLALAASAFWKGLLYDRMALHTALEIAPCGSPEEDRRLQLDVARRGLEARHTGGSVLDLAKDALALARQGLRTLAPEEVRYLEPLEELGQRQALCPADLLIQKYQAAGGDILRLLRQLTI